MKRLLTAIALICASLPAFGQYIHNATVNTASYPYSVLVEGDQWHTGTWISRVETYAFNDSTVNIDIYWYDCPGFQMITPYDTLVQLGFAHDPVFNLQVTSYLDTCYVHEYCYYNDSIYQLDSMYFPADEILALDEMAAGQITVWPNPATAVLHVAAEEPVLWLELYDVGGKRVARKETDFLDVAELRPGVYFLSVETAGGRTLRKVVIE